MPTEDSVLSFVDLGGERVRAAPIRMHLLDQPAVRLADVSLAGARLKPQYLIGFVRAHAGRARRRALPPSLISLNVLSPSGMCSVEISFQEP